MPVLQETDAGNLCQVSYPFLGWVGEHYIAKLGDDVFGLPLHNGIEISHSEGFFRQRPHLGPASDNNQVGMKLLGLASNLVSPGSLVNQGGDQQDIHSFKVFVWVHQADSVFKPNFPFVEEGPIFPLTQGSREE